jgi:hypothetical protein
MAKRRYYCAMIKFTRAVFVGVLLFMPPAYADMGPSRSLNKNGAPVTSDGAGWSAITSKITARQIADWIFCNCIDIDNSYDALRGVGILTPGSTINLVNGVGGYVMSQTPYIGPFPTAVALFGMGIADVDGGKVWGLNTALSDNRGQTGVTAHTGRSMYNELDINFTSPSSTGIGLLVAGRSLAQPSAAIGFACSSLDQNNGNTAKWSHCYRSDDGVTDTFGVVSSKTVNTGSTTSDSQSLTFVSYLSGTQKAQAVYFGSDGDFHATAGMQVNGGLKLHVYTVAQLTSAYTCNSGNEGLLASVSDANSTTFNATLVGGGSNHVLAYCNGTAFTVH